MTANSHLHGESRRHTGYLDVSQTYLTRGEYWRLRTVTGFVTFFTCCANTVNTILSLTLKLWGLLCKYVRCEVSHTGRNIGEKFYSFETCNVSFCVSPNSK